jgi:tellurite methyltransferase
MKQIDLKHTLGKVDIYLLDQLMKNRYSENDLILDAGCGSGRNFRFMSSLGFNITGCDVNKDEINKLKQDYPLLKLDVSNLDDLKYTSNSFDHIICNAVLHFATNETEFKKMTSELHRVLKPNGTLFIRMTSEFGIEKRIVPADGQFLLPDNSHRFILNTELINYLKLSFDFIEPLKTVNVNNLRCMSTLVLRKKS